MREFVHSFQMFVRQDLPLFLLMTGLYDNINALQNEKGITFLYRAPKIDLAPLSVRTIARNYLKTFQLDTSSSLEMANLTKGYSYAFQLLGYLTWENNGVYRDVIEEYRTNLADYAYDKIWSELSASDQQIAHGIAAADSRRIVDIRNQLGIDTNHFNPYRRRLIKKGIINGDQYGCVDFTLPFFKEYVLDTYLANSSDT